MIHQRWSVACTAYLTFAMALGRSVAMANGSRRGSLREVAKMLLPWNMARRLFLAGPTGLGRNGNCIDDANAAVTDPGLLSPNGDGSGDENMWLEDVTGDSSLAWVRRRNAEALKRIGEPSKTLVYDRILSILDSKDKIPYVARRDGHYYNLWKDKKNEKGLWRRTTLDEFCKESPEWETVLDIDALNEAEGENWVWKGSNFLFEGEGIPKDRCMLSLSRGGADASVQREFDVVKKAFVDPKEGGFYLPEAKSRVSWRSRDVLLVGSNFGEGSQTDSGYPRTAREWRRGTELAAAPTVFAGEASDVAAGQRVSHQRGVVTEWQYRAITFYTSEYRIRVDDDSDFVKLDVQEDAEPSLFADQLLVSLRSAWRPVEGGEEYPKGSLLSFPLHRFLAGDRSEVTPLFVPTDTVSLSDWSGTRNVLVLRLLDDVKSKLKFWRFDGRAWIDSGSDAGVGLNDLNCWAVDEDEDDMLWVTVDGYTTPASLHIVDCAGVSPETTALMASDACRKLKSLPEQFDATGVKVEQYFAVSEDGTRVPYMMVSKEAPNDGSTPTLLYGYGGFEISLLPYYSGAVGAGWLERGGCFVVANIRGGGEYGPRWHQAALKENRNKAYEDFAAVAEHLIARGVTSSAKLGIMGGSNGGLLVGNMLVRRPELFSAVVCQVPLLDMRRYTKLLAGASWAAEYGDPDKPEEWDFVKRYSPYHRIERGTRYPATLFCTSTRDDRVHPGHARKMVKRMADVAAAEGLTSEAAGIHYYENIEGGHGGAANNQQNAFMRTLAYEFLWKTIG